MTADSSAPRKEASMGWALLHICTCTSDFRSYSPISARFFPYLKKSKGWYKTSLRTLRGTSCAPPVNTKVTPFCEGGRDMNREKASVGKNCNRPEGQNMKSRSPHLHKTTAPPQKNTTEEWGKMSQTMLSTCWQYTNPHCNSQVRTERGGGVSLQFPGEIPGACETRQGCVVERAGAWFLRSTY